VTELDSPSKKQPITMNFKGRSPDELSVKQGDQVAILDVPAKSDDRVYIVKFRGDGTEESRGWIPKYVLESEKQTPKG
jgi:hypothetical protein